MKRGFTLIELLVVIVIIGILSGIILVSLSGSKAKARDAQRVSDLGQIQLALELYYDRCNQYPGRLVTGATAGCPSGSGVTLGSYISQIPTPPTGTSQLSYDYVRLVSSSGSTINYVLHAALEYSNPDAGKGLNAAAITSIKNNAPSGSSWTTDPATFNCDNAASSLNYCVSPN